MLALALALAAPAAAADGEAALGLLRSCLDAAGTRADAQACAGAWARDCMAAEGGGTTLGMVDCARAEAAAWDALLNETWADLVLLARRRALLEAEAGAEPGPHEAMLREAQRAWLAFRDADCEQEYALWGEGSMRSVAGAFCTLDRTATRVLELRAKRDAMDLD